MIECAIKKDSNLKFETAVLVFIYLAALLNPVQEW